MFSNGSEATLESKYCNFLLFLARLEKNIELKRQNLCELDSFEPYCAFRILDADCKNFITLDDATNFLRPFGFSFPPEIISSSLMARYDSNHDGVLSYSEFLKAVLPFDDPGLRTLVTQKPVTERFPDANSQKTVALALAELFNEEIACFLTLKEKQNELFGEDQWLFQQIFQEIDSKATGFIEFKNIFDFFRKNSIFPYDEEIISLLHRFDSDGDGRLIVEDMRDFLRICPPSNKIPRKSDFFDIDKNSVEKMHEVANFLVSSMNNNQKNPWKNTISSPVKQSLTRYDYYPYDSIRKFNSPDRMTPQKSIKIEENDDFNKNSNKKKSGYNKNYNNLYESNVNNPPPKPKDSSHENEREKFVSQMKEAPNQKIQYRNTVKPQSIGENVEKIAKKNKSIAAPSELSQVQESEIIKAIIKDVEQKNAFWKEIDQTTQETFHKLNIPNPDDVPLQKILEYLIKIIKTQAKLAELKESLFKSSDFNLIDFFGFFDKNKRGFCSIEEFKKTLKEQDTEIDELSLNLLIRKYDRKNTQKLRFVDFERLIVANACAENDRKPINLFNFNFKYKELFSLETRKIISKLIAYSAFAEKHFENIREEMQKIIGESKNSNILEQIFMEIDQNQDSFISEEELKNFFSKFEYHIENRELKILMKFFDYDKDEKISLGEFLYEYQQKILKEEQPNENNQKSENLHEEEKDNSEQNKGNAEKEQIIKSEQSEQNEQNEQNSKNEQISKNEQNEQINKNEQNEQNEQISNNEQNEQTVEKKQKNEKRVEIKEDEENKENVSKEKVERSKKSSIKKQSISNKQPLVQYEIEDPEERDKLSFLEYKHTKGVVSPEIVQKKQQEKSENDRKISLKQNNEENNDEKSESSEEINNSEK